MSHVAKYQVEEEEMPLSGSRKRKKNCMRLMSEGCIVPFILAIKSIVFHRTVLEVLTYLMI